MSANVGIRLCLRVMGQLENEMVLGTSAYRNGVRATTFGPKDKGIGYLVGAADDPQIVRSYYIDAPTAARIGQRARGLREATGRLSGHAAGIDTLDATVAPADTLLVDLLAVFPADEDKAWSETWSPGSPHTARPSTAGGDQSSWPPRCALRGAHRTGLVRPRCRRQAGQPARPGPRPPHPA